MLESAQQIKKIDLTLTRLDFLRVVFSGGGGGGSIWPNQTVLGLNYFVINHQWFRVACIMLRNLQNTNSQVLPIKTPTVNPITDWHQLDFLKLHNLNNINRPSPNWLGLTWNLKLSIVKTNLAFDQQNRKESIKNAHFAFFVAYFSIH